MKEEELVDAYLSLRLFIHSLILHIQSDTPPQRVLRSAADTGQPNAACLLSSHAAQSADTCQLNAACLSSSHAARSDAHLPVTLFLHPPPAMAAELMSNYASSRHADEGAPRNGRGKITSVCLEGHALLRILKHCREAFPVTVAGTLLGLDVENGVCEVTNCFPAAFDDSDEYPVRMMKALKEINVDYNAVGWYSSTYLGSYFTKDTVEHHAAYQSEAPNSVLLVYDNVPTTQVCRIAAVCALWRACALSPTFLLSTLIPPLPSAHPPPGLPVHQGAALDRRVHGRVALADAPRLGSIHAPPAVVHF